MTTTLVFAQSNDGYLVAAGASWNVRNGPATGIADAVSQSFYGSRKEPDGSYAAWETFLQFTYAAVPATQVVTSAVLQLYHVNHAGLGVDRNLEVWSGAWASGGLQLADWKTPAVLGAGTRYGQVSGVQSSAGKYAYAGSEALASAVAAGTSLEMVLASSRMRTGIQPTGDEISSIWSVNQTGTTYDPCLIFTTTEKHRLTPVLGAEVQLSDGTFVGIYNDGAGSPGIHLRHYDAANVSTVVSADFPIGTTLATFRIPRGAQGFALAVDDADNLYVIGVAGAAGNQLQVRAYLKGSGYTWTPQLLWGLSLPAYGEPVNNVAAAWHPTAGGTLMVAVGHMAGEGAAGSGGNELAYLLVSAATLRTGHGTAIRGSGSLLGRLQESTFDPNYWNTYANETGTGLDLAVDHSQPNQGFLVSFRKGTTPGQNWIVGLGFYLLNAAGTSFLATGYDSTVVWAQKEASGKVRVLSVGPNQVAAVTADGDSGFGLTVTVLQGSEFTLLGRVWMGLEGIASFPAGSTLALTPAWDAVYSPAENAIWIYYVDQADATRLMRTKVDLTTYRAVRNEVEVQNAATGFRALRIARNGTWVGGKVHLSAGVDVVGTPSFSSIMDTLNLAPLAPVLTPHQNYDATGASVFTWAFRDPNPGDTPSRYQIAIENVATGAVAYDSGQVFSASQSHNVPAASLANGNSYRWRVMTWDAGTLAGPWSDYGTFSTGAGGLVTIIDPATDNLAGIESDSWLIRWSIAGTTQTKMRVWVVRNDTSATVYDSGWVTSSGQEHTVTGMVSDVEHTVRVQVENAGLVQSAIGTRLITPTYGTPEVPVVSAEPWADEGYVLVSVTNPISGDLGFPVFDMEDGDFSGWFLQNATLTQDATHVHEGDWAGKLTATAVSPDVRTRIPALPAEEDRRYRLIIWLYSVGAVSAAAIFDWSNSGGYLSSSWTDVALPGGAWVQVTVEAPAPTGATFLTAGWDIKGSPAIGTAIWGDELTVTEASDRPEVVRNVIMRRRAGTQDLWEVLGECDPDGFFRDYEAPGGQELEYQVRAESV